MNDGSTKTGIYGLTGCRGDQLTVLDCGDRIIELLRGSGIRSFIMTASDNREGRMDIALVEGSVSTQGDKEGLLSIRERSDVLVALGTCACTGGLQAAFQDWAQWQENYGRVYGDPEMEHTAPCPSRPLDAYVKVDFHVPGCPISEKQLLHAMKSIIASGPPGPDARPLCAQCALKGEDCLLRKGIACLGPLTASGCGAVCPWHNIGCTGCWGPAGEPDLEELPRLFPGGRFDAAFIRRMMGAFSGARIEELTVRVEGVMK
ncbi:MAG: oxidoreductase [Pseudomonadota bacterium]